MTVKRMTLVQELTKFIGLGGRLHLEWIASSEGQKFARVVTDFTEKIRSLGPSPMKEAGAAQQAVSKLLGSSEELSQKQDMFSVKHLSE